MGGTPDYDSKGVIDNAPEMWMAEIDYFKKLLIELAQDKQPLEILEWGSGNGTVFFANFL